MNDFKTHTITPEDKNETKYTIKSALLKHDEILFAYIYGSFVDPEISYFRDIDIGIYVDEKIVPSKRIIDYSIEISIELESLLQRYPVDVVILNNAPLSLAFRIIQSELLFIKDENLWTDFVTRIWSLYNDHAITSRHLLEDIITA